MFRSRHEYGRPLRAGALARHHALIRLNLAIAIAGMMFPRAWTNAAAAHDIHTIKHVVVIMQENRSFDNYFGTFPGATGIPMANGKPTVCAPDPNTGTCVAPFVDHNDVNGGGPHGGNAATHDINGGRMDGFIHRALSGHRGCESALNPVCVPVAAHGALPDVMGYHTGSDIPNYWTYARDFVLQDH